MFLYCAFVHIVRCGNENLEKNLGCPRTFRDVHTIGSKICVYYIQTPLLVLIVYVDSSDFAGLSYN
jgi:hypothetical protein